VKVNEPQYGIPAVKAAEPEIAVQAGESMGRQASALFSLKSFRFAALVSAAYLLLSYVLIGFKTDQLVLVALFNGLYFASLTTRKFITGFSIFIVFWIIFDYMKAFPNYKYNTVHIASLYNMEKQLFGIRFNGVLLTLNEFFASHHTTWLDIFTGFCYLCWVPVPLLFAGILFFRNKEAFFYFSLSFLLVNIIGFIGYYVYPAAPPWYIQQYGFDFNAATPGNTAGLGRFDAFFGVHVFAGLYSKSSNVFAAMPSLHAAYLLIVLYYGIRYRAGFVLNLLFAVILAGIWFSAVYNSHHYVLDVLAGITCAIAGIALFRWFAGKTRAGRTMMAHLVAITS
jgi:hypothetical protein